MTRIIDADALVAQIEKECCINCVHRKGSSGRFIYDIGDAPCKACGVHDAVDWIENADEIDAMPVVHGHWTNPSISVSGRSSAECSVCGCVVHDSFSNVINYCPNCGANMKGEE